MKKWRGGKRRKTSSSLRVLIKRNDSAKLVWRKCEINLIPKKKYDMNSWISFRVFLILIELNDLNNIGNL
jgi:hypothetical protein